MRIHPQFLREQFFLMTLGHLLTTHRIVPELSAGDRWGVLEELVDVLVSEGRVESAHRDSVLAALRFREETMSTGIGFGVAIPHASSEHVREVVAVFGRSASGVDFGALDGSAVKFVVMFIVPKNQFQAHLRTLAAIAKFLNDRMVRDRLAHAQGREEILSIFSAGR
jgi:mannitol/fructose-specific phosphotransferase system IIA component (Ntr-type)